jgi:hypothetical protein
MPDNAFTLLTLVGMGVTPYSARGITQSLNHIDAAAQSRRTVNGDLKDLSFSGFRKYKSTLNGADQLPPALDGVWPGKILTVGCVSELVYLTAGGAPERTVIAGSSRTEGLFTYYRPELTMMVLTYTVDTDEYGAAVSWTMELEEV